MARSDRMQPGSLDTIVPSAARTASGDSGPLYAFGAASVLRVQLDVTAAAGTSPTLDVVVEDTLDGTNWNVIGTFAQKVAVGREVLNVAAPFTDRLRVRWTIGGVGASFTFSVLAYSE
jgi:hypothetical protein